jgi:hypothetical protein
MVATGERCGQDGRIEGDQRGKSKSGKEKKKGRDAMDGCSFGGRNKKQGVSKGGLRQTITTTADSPFSTQAHTQPLV